jgi:hypothetical protein
MIEAATAAAPEAAPAPWSPELAAAAERLAPEAAAARIESLKADKGFYDALQRKDAAARLEWDALHRAATSQPPLPAPSIQAEADVKTQAEQRAIAATEEYLAFQQNKGWLQPDQADAVRAGVINAKEYEFHLSKFNELRNSRDPKDRVRESYDAQQRWARANGGMSLRVADPENLSPAAAERYWRTKR